MNIIYIDSLSVYSLAAIIKSGIKYSHIFYFNTSSVARLFSNMFARMRLLKAKPQLADFCYADIKDGNGGCQFVRITEDIKDLCLEICDKEFANSGFLRKFSQYFDYKKIVIYFEKILASEIHDIIVFIHAAQWHAKHKVITENRPVVFFMQKKLWSQYISQYAIKLNIRSVEYRSIISPFYFNYFDKGKKFIFAVKSRLKLAKVNKKGNKGKKISLQPIVKHISCIAARYMGWTITFDLKKRSDFFWFFKSKIPCDRVMICFDRTDIPATHDMVSTMKKGGLNSIALSGQATKSNEIPVWHSTEKYKEVKGFFIKLVIKSYFLNLLKFNFIPLFLLFNMLYFVFKYAYWYDFFKSNGIKIYVDPSDYSISSIPMRLALDQNGGVNISYQWSNLSLSSVMFSSCTDILFSFGPAYKQVWKQNNSKIGNLIYCGYITDHSFKEVKEDSLRLRRYLLDKGVDFITCYFDENSSDERMSVIPNKRSAEIYEFFIRKMLEDETIGLIFKPVYPRTLYKRIASIRDLVEKAKETGRCIFIDKGSYATEQYPTEAAQAADLCVGLLLSGTVALESYLSGTPTVFIDLEKLYSNPIYQWGKGKVVFDRLDNLFSAIQQFRNDPKSIPGFGDLSTWAKDRDPFKDGNASLRIGQYINWLLEMFNQGKTREDAIEYANQRYAELWGRENVVKWH